ncbi:DUF4143 domain-containing protein [Rothia amarae]|uniref:DUF4143 domain-containing protein n=2 Tax=Rothia amarae TaxID=169480 RepID=UPI0031D11780
MYIHLYIQCTILYMVLYPRFIEPTIREHLAVTPVLIVEGARAVGKTSLVQKLRTDGLLTAVYSMTDVELRKTVENDPVAWLRGRTWPCAIDEAQLVPDLPLALKTILDENSDQIRVLLTGSSSIGQTQTNFGGSDPLARRAFRITLEPLSEAEIFAGEQLLAPWSIIDEMFRAEPSDTERSLGFPSQNEIFTRGGMPQYRVSETTKSPGLLRSAIEQGIRSILTERVKPGEIFDQQRAYELLAYILRHPASELNMSEAGRDLSIDRRTVDSYINALEKRFLVYEVPNFHRPSKRTLRSSAKFFPADLALSTHVITSQSDKRLDDSDIRGRLTEAHVVQQMRAHAGWSELEVDIFHWRQSIKQKPAEVDLVLRDRQGRLVAIEVKSSTRFKADHLKGIRAFKELYPDDFHRGFLVSHNPEVMRVSEDIWAIPIEYLGSRDSWEGDFALQIPPQIADGEEAQDEIEMLGEDMSDTQIFMSYTHQDADSVVGGDMRQFGRDIAEALESLFGRSVDLFLDTDKARWGEHLWNRLDAEIQRSTFFMPFITPRYLNSKACVDEFQKFLDAAERAGAEKQLMLPLVWITPPAFKRNTGNSLIVERVKQTLYQDVSEIRTLDRSASGYRQKVEELAGYINEMIEEREQQGIEISESTSTEEEEVAKGAFDYLAEIEETYPQVESSLESFMSAFTQLGLGFQESGGKLNEQALSNPFQTQKLLKEMAKELAPLAKETEEKSQEASKKWSELISKLNRGVHLLSEASVEDVPDSLIHDIASIRDTLQKLEGVAEIESIAIQMPKLSSALTPISRAFLSSIRTINSMEESVSDWLRSIGYEK